MSGILLGSLNYNNTQYFTFSKNVTCKQRLVASALLLLLGWTSVLHTLKLSYCFYFGCDLWRHRFRTACVWMQGALFVIKIWCGLTRGFKRLLGFFTTKTCVPIRSHRGYITSPSSSSSSRPCRWTDEHGGEEEEEAAQEQDHLQQQPAPGSGASVREDALPRRLRQGGPGPPGQPHRGQSPGTIRDVTSDFYFDTSSCISK